MVQEIRKMFGKKSAYGRMDLGLEVVNQFTGTNRSQINPCKESRRNSQDQRRVGVRKMGARRVGRASIRNLYQQLTLEADQIDRDWRSVYA